MTSITLTVEISERLYTNLMTVLETEDQWDFNQVFEVALSRFLLSKSSESSINNLPSVQTHLKKMEEGCPLIIVSEEQLADFIQKVMEREQENKGNKRLNSTVLNLRKKTR